MIKDRKGDIGFMEAIVGAAAVCIVLTAFMGFVADDIRGQSDVHQDFDWSSISGLTVRDMGYGVRGFDIEYSVMPWDYIGTHGLSGIHISVQTAYGHGIVAYSFYTGSLTGTFSESKKLVSVVCGDETIPAVLEVRSYY